MPSNKQSESLYTLEAPTELTEDHWISSSKLPTISQQQLKKLIQPTLGKELTLIQKQKLLIFLLKYSILARTRWSRPYSFNLSQNRKFQNSVCKA